MGVTLARHLNRPRRQPAQQGNLLYPRPQRCGDRVRMGMVLYMMAGALATTRPEPPTPSSSER